MYKIHSDDNNPQTLFKQNAHYLHYDLIATSIALLARSSMNPPGRRNTDTHLSADGKKRKHSNHSSTTLKERCPSCGREVKVGQMSRHLSTNQQCVEDYPRDGVPDGTSTLVRASVPRITTEGQCQPHSNRHTTSHSITNRFVEPVDSITPLFPCTDDDFPIESYDDEDVPPSEYHDRTISEIQPSTTTQSEQVRFTTTPSDDTVPSQQDGTTDCHSAGQADDSLLAAYEGAITTMNDRGLSLSLFSREEQVQIDLLQTLNKLGAPMKAYEEVMRWATRSVQQGHNFCDTPLTSRKTLVSKLSARLSRVALEPMRADLYLPYSNVTISIVYFNASAVFTDLLSCPQLNRDENYIFHGDFNPDYSPFAVPPRNVIGDINTGRSYHYTHRKLCQNPNDMLLPCVLAIDKTTCDISGSGRLPMEPITIQYGLMKHDVRKKPYAMRVLGYINCSTTHSRSNSNPNRTTPLPRSPEVSDAALRLNEYHMQVKFILERSGFLALQEHGFKWNLKYHGKTFQTILHPYVPFIIGDTEGHDTLCGHYKSRTSGVSQLCRVCECPTEKSGWSKGRYFTRRTPAAVNDLVQRGNLEGLKLKSQHYLLNAFDTVRFGQHDKRGIFGACPGEILHLVLIGWFKYVVESFFAQAGKNSIAVQKYVTLCHDIGLQLDRQSDRNVPRTSFRDFSSASNIPGNEYAGCLFIMLISMHTSRYMEIFSRSRLAKCQKAADKHLGNPNFMEDWKDLLTSLLEWLAWLKQPQISRVSAQRSVFATAHLMRLVKFVAPRFKGMSNNTIKMHLVLHIHEDIINFGVPEVMNSAYAESSHRPIAKFTVRNTQKRHKTFTFQAANRYVENLSIAQGSQVVSDDRKKNTLTTTGEERAWTGKEFTITLDNNKRPICQWRLDKKKKSQVPSVRPIPEDHVLLMIANHCHPHVFPPVIHCQTEFITDEGQIYRAHPSYQDAPWYDHVLLDWSECDDPLPARICTFINLFNIKANASICFPESGQETVRCPPGVYAVVESYDPIPPFTSEAEDESFDSEDDTPPDLFQHYTKTLLSNNISPKLYLVNVKAIVGPTVVVSDVVGDPSDVSVSGRHTHIFMAVRRKEWASRWEHKVDLAYQEKNEDGAESTEDEDDSATIKDRRMYKRMHGTT